VNVDDPMHRGASLFEQLQEILRRPPPFERCTTRELWTDEHTSARMLAYHLDGSIDVSSRRTSFIERSAAWIAARFELGEGKSVLDLGCGPGLYANRLAATGARVLGVDFSERSLRHARASAAAGLPVEYLCADYRELETVGRFDLATLIMNDYCALGPADRTRLLDRIGALLAPGGALLLDVYSLRAFEARQEGTQLAPGLLDGFWSAAPYIGISCTFKYDAEKVVLDRYTIVERDRTRVVQNWLQCFDVSALVAELEGQGLVVEEVLGDVAGAPFDPAGPEFAVVARR